MQNSPETKNTFLPRKNTVIMDHHSMSGGIPHVIQHAPLEGFRQSGCDNLKGDVIYIRK